MTPTKSYEIFEKLSITLLVIGLLGAFGCVYEWFLNPKTDWLKHNDMTLEMSGLPIECNPLRDIPKDKRPKECDVLSSYYGGLYK